MKWIGQHIYDLAARFRGDVTIEGDLTVNGTYTQIDTDVTTTEQWLVTNDGTGPAAIINQKGSQDIFDVQDDGTSVFYIEDGGNVGIGTTNPLADLHVESKILISQDVNNRPKLAFSENVGNGTDEFIIEYQGVGAGSGNYVSFYSDVSSWSDLGEGFNYIPENGRVGIGTTSPGVKLEVSGDHIRLSDAYSLQWVNANNRIYNQSNATVFVNNASESMRITSAGNVGVGTTSPGKTLTVDTTSSNAFEIRRSGTRRILSDATSSNGGFIYTGSLGNKWALGTSGNDFRLYDGSYLGDGDVRLHVNGSNGNVGIGTSSPGHKLSISGGNAQISHTEPTLFFNDTTTGHDDWKIYADWDKFYIQQYVGDSSYSTRLMSDASGNIGIGTTSPGHPLQVEGGAWPSKAAVFSDGYYAYNFGHGSKGSGVASADINFWTISNTFHIDNGTGGAILFDQGGTERMRINLGGNVGIGTASPSEKLHVVGDTLITGDSLADTFKPAAAGEPIKFKNFGSTELARITDAGNVGIGTTSPASTLDIYDDSTTYAATILNNNSGGKGLLIKSGNAGGGTNAILDLADKSSNIKLRVVENGNVGIGTTSPTAKLESIAPDGSTFSLRVGRADTSNVWNVNHAGDDFRLYNTASSGSNILFGVDSGGTVKANNVGIGTASPTGKLEIDGGDFIINNDHLIKSKNNLNYINIYKGSDASMKFKMGHSSVGRFQFLNNSNTEVFTIDARNENVGIGTTSPGRKLTVAGSDNLIFLDSTGNSYLTIDRSATDRRSALVLSTAGNGTSGIPNNINWALGAADSDEVGDGTGFFIGTNTNATSSKLFIEQSGNVGIGTTAPEEKLQVNGILNIVANDSAYTAGYFTKIKSEWGVSPFIIESKYGDLIKAEDYGKSLSFHTGEPATSERMRITSAGNVGIGTSAPASKLHVEGAVQIGVNDAGHDFTLYGDTANYNMMWDASSSRLEANDNVKFNFGTGNDLSIYHTGSHSNIQASGTGDLKITQTTDDQDIIFQCDDGSGGTTPYLTLDGSTKRVEVDVQMGINTPAVYTANASADELVVGSGSGTQGMTIYGATGTIYFATDLDEEGAGDGPAGNRHGILKYTPSEFTFKTGGNQPAAVIGNGGSSFTSTLTVGVDDTGHDVKFYGATSGKYMQWDESDDSLNLTDSTFAKFGTGGDLTIEHNGSHSYITNGTGDFKIKQHADDKDLILECDDGSGGTTAYLTLDGSSKRNIFSENVVIANKYLYFGTHLNAHIRHDGSNLTLANTAGNITFTQNTDDGDIIFQSDDGAGGTATYFQLDGSAGTIEVAKTTRLADSVSLKLGSATDLELFHDGTNSFINNNTGPMFIRQNVDDGDIRFQSDDGSGGVTDYLKLDGTAGHTVANKEIHFLDNVLARFGSTNDFAITHNGTNTTFENGTGNLVLSNYADDADIIFQSDDGGGGVSTYFYLDGSLTETNFQVRTRHVDNAQAWFGNSGDLQIYHDGTYNVIKAMSGHMLIKQDSDDQDIIFQCDNGSGGTTAYLTLDGSEGRTVVAKAMRFNDSTSLQLGSDADIQMHHDGSNGFFNNITGDLYFRQTADDKDIVFQGDNGSGGLATYFTLDGSLANGTATYTRWADNDVITLGDSQDCYFYHNATNTYLYNNTGDLIITNVADDKDIILKSDDGSGGTTAYLTLDGGLGRTTVQKNMQFADNAELWLGDGPDFKMLHDGSNTHLQQFGTGNLYIQQTTDDKDIIFQCDNGSGGTATYLQIDGGSTRTRAFKDINFDDNIKATYGAGSDLQIYHNGSHSYILNTTGDLVFNQSTDDGNILFYCDNGSGGVETYLTLDGGLGHTTIDKRLRANDNVDFTVGTGNDLRLIHDGAHSYITNYTGDFYIANHADDKDIIFQSDNGSGGLTEYLRIDGGSEEVIFSKPIVTAETQIKVLPHQFMSNEDGGANKSVQFRDDTIIGVRTTADDAELYAFVEIPYGKTATNVTVYGNDTLLTVNVYESDINAGALTDKTPVGGCRVGGACDIDDVEYSATNYLVIKVTTVSYTNDIVYGAVVTIT